MKFKALIFTILASVQLNAQKEIKIVKIDNSQYPKIELLIKSSKKFKPEKLKIIENEINLTFLTSDVPLKDIKKERRILFLINDFEIEKLKGLLNDEIGKLKKTDKINIGIMRKNSVGKINIQYLSPEFSKNKQFFLNNLEEVQVDIKKQKKKNCKIEKKIQTYLFSENSDLKNIGIIIIGNFENNDFNFCTRIQKESPAPIYVLQTNSLKKETEDKIISVCMKSGGMYTQSKSGKDRLKILNRYTEDISLDPFNSKSNLKRIIFETTGKSNEAKIKINYENYKREFTIKKQEKNKFSKNELYLTAFSSILFLFIILLLWRNRRSKQKNENNNNFQLTNNVTIPIEINIKGKGINKTYFFEKHLIRIGRNKDNDIVIPDTTVSGSHAIINKQGEKLIIQDLRSTNGVVVNQKKVKKYVLKSKDQIKLGGIIMYVRF